VDERQQDICRHNTTSVTKLALPTTGVDRNVEEKIADTSDSVQ